jgi:HAE1 family hydrophobic/amphiphilic exporter-1
MTSLIMIGILFFGILAYRLLPVSSLPTMQYPTIQVTTNYPGASPETVADLVASPLERQLITMQGIRMLSSSNTYQTSTIVCQFYLDVDVNVAAQEVQEAINQAMGNLPANLPENPTYVKANPSDTPIIYLTVHSNTMTAAELYDYGYTYLGQQIRTIEGVALVKPTGSQEQSESISIPKHWLLKT